MTFGRLLRLSRPRFWFYLLGPALIGIAVQPDPVQAVTALPTLLFVLAWTLPANLYLYGINDLCDADTDAHNRKKDTYEVRLENRERWRTALAVSVAALVLLGAALSTQHPGAIGYSILFLILATGYSAPPLRWKARPVWDFVSNVLYIVPGLAVASLGDRTILASALVAGWAWSSGMHLFSAIPDIEPDRQARVRTTAVAVGHRTSLWIVSGLWSIAALATLSIPGLLASRFIAWLYPLLCLLLLSQTPEHTARAYRWMPIVNILAGAVLFWDIILP